MTFLFPRLDRGSIISDFEKIAFFDSGAILGDFSLPKRSFFAARTLFKIPLLFEKNQKMKIFCGFFRNTSKLIYSDNTKSFISGVHVLEKVFTSAEFRESFGIYNIQHIRIPLYSPWVGSTWERLIRTIKECLKNLLGGPFLIIFIL